MTLAEIVAAVIWVGVTAYTLFGGADFGAGVWDLFAGNPRDGARIRDQLERSIGPVWEANHVWLIFVLVYLWTAFPTAFVSIMTTLYIPMMLAAFGIIFRGSAFAFRKWAPTLSKRRIMGALFAGSSFLTPMFLGAVAGAVASGRVPLGNAEGDPWSSWLSPTSALGATLAVVTCAYMAAVLVARDAARAGDPGLAAYFRIRALVSGAAAGLVALGGVAVIRADAPLLFEGLTSPLGIAVISVSAMAGAGSLAAIWNRRRHLSRLLAVVAVAAVIWGWAVGQYPWLLPDVLTIEEGAASTAVLWSLLIAFAASALLAVPALIWLFALTERGVLDDGTGTSMDSTDAWLRARMADQGVGAADPTGSME
jgi:cytochrome d ubiquinol oxidase subunit II